MKAGEEWFAKSLLEDAFQGYKSVWELYLKFETVFLSINFVALGVAIQHVKPEHRGPLVWAFVIQNAVTSTTSLCVAIYSWKTVQRYEQICKKIIEMAPVNKPLSQLALSPVPAWVGVYAAWPT